MTTIGSKVWDMLHLIRNGGPALCTIAITNSCNATCDFCNFANGTVGRKDLRWIDVEQFEIALEILHGRGIPTSASSVENRLCTPAYLT